MANTVTDYIPCVSLKIYLSTCHSGELWPDPCLSYPNYSLYLVAAGILNRLSQELVEVDH